MRLSRPVWQIAKKSVQSVLEGECSRSSTTTTMNKPVREQRTRAWSPTRDALVHPRHQSPRTNRFKAQPQSNTFTDACARAQIEPRLAFVGAGNMARALIKGFIQSKLVCGSAISASDPFTDTHEAVESLGANMKSDNAELLSESGSIVLLCFKPNMLHDFATESALALSNAGLVVSVLAGVTLDTLEKELGTTVPIIRVMPNTPAMYACGASVFCGNDLVTIDHKSIISQLLETVGSCHEVPESQVDAVTGVSGSGPAYVFTVIDSLADGGVKMGLPRELANHLAAQTVMGAAQMVLQSGSNPNELKSQVCSAGGTTIAGVHELELAAVRGAFISAVEAAVKRAKEMAES